MVERRVQELRRDPLWPLVRCDDETDDRADVRVSIARDRDELGFRRGVAPAHDAPQAIRDKPVGFRGFDQVASKGAVLLLRSRLVVVDDPFAAKTFRPVRVVCVRDHVEVVHDGVVLVGRNRPDGDFAHRPRLPHWVSVVIWSVGHGARPLEEFLAVLRAAEIDTLADVRLMPGSRRHPHFGAESLDGALREIGMAYLHMPELGGRREPRADSPHRALRVAAFRGYAGHMSSEEFAEGYERLTSLATQSRTALMCAETLWWRCHRRLIADHLT